VREGPGDESTRRQRLHTGPAEKQPGWRLSSDPPQS
jgi:hypothetical protein